MMTLTISTDFTLSGGTPATLPQPDAARPDATPAPAVRQRFEQLLRQSAVGAPFAQDTVGQRQPAAADVAASDKPLAAAAPQNTSSAGGSPSAPAAPAVASAMSQKTLSASQHAPLATESPSAYPAPDEPSASAPPHTPSAAETPSASTMPEVPLVAAFWPVAAAAVAVVSPEGKPAANQPDQQKASPAVAPTAERAALPDEGAVPQTPGQRPAVTDSARLPAVPPFASSSAALPVVPEPSAPSVDQPVGPEADLPSSVPPTVAVVSGASSADVQQVMAESERPLPAQPLSPEASAVSGVLPPAGGGEVSPALRPSAPLETAQTASSVAAPSAGTTLSPQEASEVSAAERPLVWGQPVELEGARQALTLPSAPSWVQAFPLSDAESEEPGGTVGQQQAVVLVCQAWLTPLPPQAAAETPDAPPSRPSVSVFGDASQPLPFAVQPESSEGDGLPSLTAYVLTSRGSVCETRLPLHEAEALLTRLASDATATAGLVTEQVSGLSSSSEPMPAGVSGRLPEAGVQDASLARRQPVLLLVAPPETPMTLADVQNLAAETLPQLAALASPWPAAFAPVAETGMGAGLDHTDSTRPTDASAPMSPAMPSSASGTSGRASVQSRMAGTMTSEFSGVVPAEQGVRRQVASASESSEPERVVTGRQESSPSQPAAGFAAASPEPATVTVDLRSPVAPLLSRELSDSARAALLLQVADGVAEAVVMRPSLVWGEGEVLVRLSPEVLGGTEIRLRVADGGLVVRLSPSLETVTAQLQAAQPQLQAWLAERLAVYHQRIRVEVRPASREERNA